VQYHSLRQSDAVGFRKGRSVTVQPGPLYRSRAGVRLWEPHAKIECDRCGRGHGRARRLTLATTTQAQSWPHGRCDSSSAGARKRAGHRRAAVRRSAVQALGPARGDREQARRRRHSSPSTPSSARMTSTPCCCGVGHVHRASTQYASCLRPQRPRPLARVSSTIIAVSVPTALNVTRSTSWWRWRAREPGKLNLAPTPGRPRSRSTTFRWPQHHHDEDSVQRRDQGAGDLSEKPRQVMCGKSPSSRRRSKPGR